MMAGASHRSAVVDWGLEAIRRKLVGQALTKERLQAAGIDPRNKGKWGRFVEHLLGIAANSSPLPDLGADGELKTTVRDHAGDFREALRICVVGHDPLLKLRKLLLVIARDRNEAKQLEDREVTIEEVVLLEPTTVVERALEHDCEILRRDPRSRRGYFLETHPQGARHTEVRAYYVRRTRLQEYLEHVLRVARFRLLRDKLKGRRITPADFARGGYSVRDKGRFGHYVRSVLDEPLRAGVRTGLVNTQGEAKDDLLLCRKDADPVVALRGVIYVPMRSAGGVQAGQRREIVDVVYLAPTELVLHVLEHDRWLIKKGRGRQALFLRLKTQAATGKTGWSWYLKASAVSLYADVLRNQPL